MANHLSHYQRGYGYRQHDRNGETKVSSQFKDYKEGGNRRRRRRWLLRLWIRLADHYGSSANRFVFWSQQFRDWASYRNYLSIAAIYGGATIYHDCLSSNKTACFGCQHYSDTANFFRFTNAMERIVFYRPIIYLRVLP